MRILDEGSSASHEVVAEHVAITDRPSSGRALVRLNMISSADGSSTVAGLSGGLGNRDDHQVFAALRAAADVIVVGLGTAVAEHYRPTPESGPALYVVSETPVVDAAAQLFESGHTTLVLPEGTDDPTVDTPVIRAGPGPFVDLAQLVATVPGRVVLAEGGPTLAGAMVAEGLVDEFFLTLAPRVVAGVGGRVVHGGDADSAPWALRHGFVDDEGFLFLRYGRPATAGS
jgi:riboflavin biosynthesis pyrimidine reductase